MHRFNRIFLIGSIFAAALIPLLNFTEVEILPQVSIAKEVLINPVVALSRQVHTIAASQPSFRYDLFFALAYFIITGILILRFLKNLFKIRKKINTNLKLDYAHAKLVLLNEQIQPHTFMRYIFLNKKAYQANEIEEPLLLHELTHAKQKHSIDLFFIELLKVFFWFNPILYLYKKAIQLNHEFLADGAVINTSDNIIEYQFLLLGKTAVPKNLSLTSNFNYSLTKKRLIMMTKKSSNYIILLKKIALIPLVTCFIFLFSHKGIAQNLDEDEIYKVCTEMPRFPGCESIRGDAFTKKSCADTELLDFIQKNLIYPDLAKTNVLEGRVFVSFIVEKNGKISNPKLTRDIGAGCGKEALRIMNLMNEQDITWTPGRHHGEVVRVQFFIPVHFKLEG